MFVLIKLVKYSTKKKKTIAFFEQKLDLSRQIFTDNPSELNLIYAQTYKFLSLTIKFLGVIISRYFNMKPNFSQLKSVLVFGQMSKSVKLQV